MLSCTLKFRITAKKLCKLEEAPFANLPEPLLNEALTLAALVRLADGLDYSQAGTSQLGDVQRREDGTTAVPGVRVVGDLTGIPLLKFSVDTGVKAVWAILAEPDFKKGDSEDETLDLAIIGGGLSGIAAALEAKKAALRFEVYEAGEPFSTIVNFPKRKPIYTYPTDMTPAGDLKVTADVKEVEGKPVAKRGRIPGIVENPRLRRLELEK